MVTTYKTYDMGTTTIKIPKWDIEEETGYKPITTFWMDFSIADNYGKPFKTHSTVLSMRGKVITSTSQSLCLC